VTVTNLLGQKVFLSEPLTGMERKYRVTLPAGSPPGFYLVRVMLDNNDFAVRKILVK